MRELRFRAWDTVQNKYLWPWPEGFALFGEVTCFDLIGQQLSESGRSPITGLNDLLIEQFTGLRDKNGREIYEGDICRFDLQDFNGGDHFYTLPVAYTVDMFGFPYKSDQSEPEPDCCISLGEAVANDDELEVVGNIHENPELLK